MLEDLLSEGLSALSIPFSDETLRSFRTFYELVIERNRQFNLTAITDEGEFARLHFLDCAAILPYLPEGKLRVLDIGSGAGFPGLVLRALRPELSVTLLDSQQKRVSFQRELCAALGFDDVLCLHMRAEEAPAEMRESFDVVCSRAVARLTMLSELCLPFVSLQGRFLAMKGAAAEAELSEAGKALSLLGCDRVSLVPYHVPGLDAGRALILAVKGRSTPPRFPRRYSQIKAAPLS